MSKFSITVSRLGYTVVEAESEEVAAQMAEAMGYEDFDWSDEFKTCDIEEEKS